MFDDNWELINGPGAHHIEHLNATNTINVLEALVVFLLSSKDPAEVLAPMPDDWALCELHRSGTLFLLHQPGIYRLENVVLRDGNGNVYHTPPPWADVPAHMIEFFRELETIWNNGDALDVASFALWRVNWIHPFKNGNGRTARAFSYACLNAHIGLILPGSPTVIDQIVTRRPEYEAALRVADNAASNANGRDLSAMKTFLHDLLQNQILSIQKP